MENKRKFREKKCSSRTWCQYQTKDQYDLQLGDAVMVIYYIFSHLECSNIGYCRD